MKLVAWVDRGAGDPREAIDLAPLLRQYGVINQDRLYDAEIRVLEVANHDLDLAGARLLGADASRIIEAATRSQILAVLGDPARLDRLVLDVARGLRSAEDPVGAAGELLAQFKAGFDEVLPDSLPL